jgi:hypothetical protein
MNKTVRRFTGKNFWFFYGAIAVLLAGPLAVKALGSLEGAAAIYYASAIVAFIFLLDMKDDRVTKGFSLIGFGLVVQVIYTVIFKDAVPTTGHLGDNLELFAQCVVIACSGAGGSIIAVHGDKSATDADSASSPNIGPDNAIRFEMLMKKTDRLGARLTKLTWAVSALLVALIVVLFVRT